MKRSELARRTPLKRTADTTRKRRPISQASAAQREKVRDRTCLVCANPHVDPAHLIDRSLLGEGQEHKLAVVPLCRLHHREYDDHSISILEYLEPYHREELAFAVKRFGLISTLNRVTGLRWEPTI